ncbi:MAG: co-chaperone GroES [Bacteroidales bacterium]|nr:co-chaperone GroES [Bacteroidales bacterium]
MKELQPINQYVALDITEGKGEKKTASGIIIPDTAGEKPQMAKIKWMSMVENAEVKPGDMVLYKPYSGIEVEFEGSKYLLLPYADILAKVVETETI